MNMLLITPILATEIAKELPDYEEHGVNKVVRANTLK